jgi:F-type H+-transporting ATPase subunit gamma
MASIPSRGARVGEVTVQRLADLQARIRSLGELRDVVGAMRSLSAVRVQQAHETLLAIRQYAGIVESALAEAAPTLATPRVAAPREPPAPAATAVIAFGSEHGFVGAFNDHVLDRAVAHLATPADRLMVVGSRAALVAAERRHPVAWTCPMASHVGGVDDVAMRAAEETARSGAEELTRVVLVYTRSSGGATWRLVAETLLPFDVESYLPRRLRNKPTPISNLPSKELFDKLVEELVFAQLTHAAMESFASENAARLAAMESAHDNIEDKLVDMSRLEREGRQEEITTELLDVVSGAEAMTGRSP